MGALLTRDEFRRSVFERDNHKCVVCGAPGQDAHHIIERRLFDDGGYYRDNGATLCGPCHLKAESTEISVGHLYACIGVLSGPMPHYFDSNELYDKWGNIIMADSTRLAGPLYYDESVQKILDPKVEFLNRFKFPKVPHFPFSPGATKDDRILKEPLEGELVVTEKMDGENTSIYWDSFCHARSVNSRYHKSRTWVQNLAGKLCGQIPYGWRVCGENLYAKHSIKYNDLDDWFLVFAIFDEYNNCLSWDDTVEWAALLDLNTVPMIGLHEYDDCAHIAQTLDPDRQEGIVARTRSGFHWSDVHKNMAKWVRPNHVQTHGHWMWNQIEVNERKNSA